MTERMNRRHFVAAAAGGLVMLNGTGLSGLHGPLAASLDEEAQTPLLRRNIYCLGSASPVIVAYRNAIAAMQARPATDGTSWIAQANIHGASSPPAGMIVNACQHGNQFFLSWHRMYLYFFERIVRQSSGDASFALPYWGYSPTNAAHRVLPAMFRTPTSGNVLYVSQRNPSINTGSALTASAVDPGTAFLQLAFNGFSSSLEGTPHGVVHVSVGGWMSAFATAGRDPIFWLHHAQIDRLWEIWLGMGGGRANPTTAPWLNTSFQFYNETGAVVNMTGAQIVNTATQLNYRYAHPLCRLIAVPIRFEWQDLTRIPPFDPGALRLVQAINVRPPLPDPPRPIVVQEGLRLGPSPAVLRVPVSAEGKRALERFQPDSREGGTQISLVLEDIRLEQPPQVFYEVYVNLPASVRTPEYTSPHYVGNIDFFGPSSEDGHKMPFQRTISLLPAYVRLRGAGRWSDDAIQLTLVPRGATEADVPERVLGQRPQATIGRVSLRIE